MDENKKHLSPSDQKTVTSLVRKYGYVRMQSAASRAHRMIQPTLPKAESYKEGSPLPVRVFHAFLNNMPSDSRTTKELFISRVPTRNDAIFVVNNFTVRQIFGTPNFGKKSMAVVVSWLRSEGLSLREEE